jgi:hypothetical protein
LTRRDRRGGDPNPGGGAGAGEWSVGTHVEREDPGTTSIELARMWETTYHELIEMEESLLRRIHDILPTLSAVARQEAELSNLPLIVQHLQTFKYRLAFWHQRVAELDGGRRGES